MSETGDLWNYIALYYNDLARVEGLRQVNFHQFKYDTHFNCTVKGFMESTYGKMPIAESQTQIIMEISHWFDILSENLPWEI